jgi:hypothetical protein
VKGTIMGCQFEQAMYEWLWAHEDEAHKRYEAYVKAIVNSPDFNWASSIDDFHVWCMEHYRD